MSIEFQTLFIPQGWQCPACQIIHAPHVQSCACQSHPYDYTGPYDYPTTCPDPTFTIWDNDLT